MVPKLCWTLASPGELRKSTCQLPTSDPFSQNVWERKAGTDSFKRRPGDFSAHVLRDIASKGTLGVTGESVAAGLEKGQLCLVCLGDTEGGGGQMLTCKCKFDLLTVFYCVDGSSPSSSSFLPASSSSCSLMGCLVSPGGSKIQGLQNMGYAGF